MQNDAGVGAASPVPTASVTVQPAPTDAALPTVGRTIIYRNADGSVFATYTCQPYGDWRDSDPMYAHPECQ
jgi:hypothetical protein